MTEDEQAVPAARERSANVTLSRTWELELFISGATVFALMRAPGIVDAWWARTDPHLAGASNAAAYFAYYYSKLALYTLISTFVLHLVTRAYWVGLVGLHSVYPHGVRWAELNYGPAMMATFRSRLPSLESAIRKVDDVSSLLFAGGALILLLFMMSVAFTAPIAAIAFAVSEIVFGGRHLMLIGAFLLGAATVFPAVVKSLDARSGRKHGVDSPPPRLLMRLAALSFHLSMLKVIGPFSLVMTSNLGRRRGGIVLAVVIVAIIGTFAVRDVLLRTGAIAADSHIYIPDERVLQAAPAAYYADRRAAGDVFATTPSIQSEFIRDPYIRLFIPVTPERYNPVIAERCPDIPVFDGGLRIRRQRPAADPPDATPLFECLAALHAVTLNGTALDAPAFRLTTDEPSGVRGVVLFIPVEGLARGEHVLRVEGLPASSARRGARRAGSPHLIRFWL